MAENTGIEWCDHTWNCWWGCVKVSPACTHCYAATWANRYGVGWGPKAERRFFGEHHWREPVKWNAKAAKDGIRRKVFCASMADVFETLPDDHPQVEQMDTERQRAFQLMVETPHLDWLLLTKRPESILDLVPHGPRDWRKDWPTNVWAGTTVENQEWADTRIPHLLRVPAPVRFLSCEPLLGPVDLTRIPGVIDGETFEFDALEGKWHPKNGFDAGYASERLGWIVTGGESGPGARPSHPDWFRAIRDQCERARVPFFFKQNGEHRPLTTEECVSRNDVVFVKRDPSDPRTTFDGCFHMAHQLSSMLTAKEYGWQYPMLRVGKKAAGALLDGKLHREFPAP